MAETKHHYKCQLDQPHEVYHSFVRAVQHRKRDRFAWFNPSVLGISGQL